MSPLYLHDAGARAAVEGSLALWGAAELYYRWRSRAARKTLEPSFAAMLVGVGGGIAVGLLLHHVRLGVLDGGWPLLCAGIAVMLGGIAFRTWAVVVLGRFFSVTVTIQEGHRVVSDGPYSVLRHPSYTGLLITMLGFGLALSNWLSLAALAALPLAGVLIRIRAEEAALTRSLGSAYAGYAARTDRLVPGVW